MSTKEKWSFRKSSHAKNAEDGQGWEETEINDTLNVYDNAESRTPTLITQKVYDWHRQDTRMTELGDICVTAAAGWGGGGNNMPYVLESVAVESHPKDSRYQIITPETNQTIPSIM